METRDRNSAAKILFDNGWSFEEIEMVLKSKEKEVVYRDTNKNDKVNNWLDQLKPVARKPYMLETPSDIKATYDNDLVGFTSQNV